jgi:hypothetical protein
LARRWSRRRPLALALRPNTPKDCDFIPLAAISNPSAANPRFSNSRTAAARLGIRLWARKSSTAFDSSGLSMIWSRSGLMSSSAILPSS